MQLVSERLAIAQRLELRLQEDEWLLSRLEDRDSSGNRLVVAWPTDRQRRLLKIAVGDTLDLAASTRDALYSVQVRVLAAERERVPLLTVEVIGDWQRSQRRQAVRLPIAIHPRRAVRVVDMRADEALRVGITNISATGLLLRSQDELRLGDLVELTFSLSGVPDELTLASRVCRVQEDVDVWVAGCALENVSERTAEQIVQFIFAQQRAELARSRKAS